MLNSIITTLAEMLSYTFLVRAFIVGALVSVCSALLGVSLVLKRYSMIGDGLSHVGFGALAVATALNAAPLAVSIPLVLAAAVGLLRLGEKHLLKGDAAIALISTSSLALGVVIISQTTGMNTDVCNYLFGSILAMNKTDVYLSIALSITVFILFVLFYHKLFAITFDETFAKVTGVKTNFYTMLIAALTAVIIVLGMRMMGAMLISALIIFPALSSMRIFKKFKSVTICSVCVSVICFFSGIVISYVYAIPTGASVVLVNIIVFTLFCIVNVFRKEPLFMKKSGVLLKVNAILLMIVPIIISCENNRNQNSNSSDIKYAAAEVLTVSAGGASAQTSADEKIANEKTIEIKEKMFIAQTNDVYLNQDDYLGKKIKLEGLLKTEDYNGEMRYFVIRYGPGCCGSDGNAGFEIAWDKTSSKYPAEDEWVEAFGTLKTYDIEGYSALYIALNSLKTLETRGSAFVTQ